MLESIASSNAAQIATTFLVGGVLYIVFRNVNVILLVIGLFISIMIMISFILEIGEYYSYSYFYKRSFYLFGDSITTAMIPIFLWGALSRRRILSIITASAIVLSGGKIGIILLIFSIIMLSIFIKYDRKYHISSALIYIYISVPIYFSFIMLSHAVDFVGDNFYFLDSVRAVLSSPLGLEKFSDPPDYSLKGAAACSSVLRCFQTQIEAAFLQRLYSSIAGSWMTLQGGFPGELYPATSAEFADMMIKMNPWGMNDMFSIDWHYWKKIGSVQNPYLRIGSGYGLIPLGGVLLLLSSICFCAFRNLKTGEETANMAFTCFYVVNFLFNQTQPWLTSGSPILVAMGFCAFAILFRQRMLCNLSWPRGYIGFGQGRHKVTTDR